MDILNLHDRSGECDNLHDSQWDFEFNYKLFPTDESTAKDQ